MRHGRSAESRLALPLLASTILFAGFMVGWLASPASAANDSKSCISNADKSVVGWEYAGSSFDNNSKGTEASIWAPSGSAQCERISSA
ncbi:hypothetical protein BJZ21_002777 [Nocardioides panaciterrulae]|uniref:Uncharacterized protein n=1 Tax=Nocardioides panaciterrulae TaxID=661492 RepID=A0A7Y9E7M6_9ACTN|nr:hypothetical protein [Nocardioides panaciterrulae]